MLYPDNFLRPHPSVFPGFYPDNSWGPADLTRSDFVKKKPKAKGYMSFDKVRHKKFDWDNLNREPVAIMIARYYLDPNYNAPYTTERALLNMYRVRREDAERILKIALETAPVSWVQIYNIKAVQGTLIHRLEILQAAMDRAESVSDIIKLDKQINTLNKEVLMPAAQMIQTLSTLEPYDPSMDLFSKRSCNYTDHKPTGYELYGKWVDKGEK